MKTTRINPHRCPACGVKLDAVSATPDHPESTPEPGDYTLCIHCATGLVFDRVATGELTVRMPTMAEAIDMARNAGLMRVKAAIVALQRDRGRDLR